MVLLFDANPLVSSRKSGVGYYTYRLIDQLAKKYPDVELVGHYFNFLGRKNPNLPQYKNISYKTSWLLPGKVLSLFRRLGLQLPLELFFKRRGDVVLFTNFVALPSLLPIKKIMVVHDLCYIDHPEYMQPANQKFLSRFVPQSIKKSNLILTISESTKKSIEKHYPVKNKKIVVTPIPPPAIPAKTGPRPDSLSWDGKYILFVSTLEPRKNFVGLARAYTLLPQPVKDKFALVLAGGAGWHIEDSLKEINELVVAGNNILVTGYMSDADKDYLYKHASLLVMPSHYEGFGMPILEATSYGVPVAASDIGVFHEVAGKAAAYFNQDDPKDMASKIEAVLTDSDYRKSLSQEAKAQLTKFEWGEVADTVMDSIKKLIESEC